MNKIILQLFYMKTLVTLFVLLFSYSLSADDITDFEIEGISIGDTLLKYMNEEEILVEKEVNKYFYASLGDPIFFEAYIFDGFKNFDYLSFFVKSNDTNYIIQAIYGVKYYENNINDCYKKQKEISLELDNQFKNSIKNSNELPLHWDQSGKSSMKRISYELMNQDIIALECYDWDESMQKGNPPNPDILSLSLNRKELFSWIN